MPDLSTPTTVFLSSCTYESTSIFLSMMGFILVKLNEFHCKKNLVHYDIKEDHILFDAANQTLKFVDYGLSRHVGQKVHPIVYNTKTHQEKESAGYFPPVLNPTESKQIDIKAKITHDIYMTGRMMTRLFDRAKKENGNKLTFLSVVATEFKKMTAAMQANSESRIELTEAIPQLAKLTIINHLLENQDLLIELNADLEESISNLQEMLSGDEEIIKLAKYFKTENQSTFLKLFDVEIDEHLHVTALKV